ncbi:MAG: hypothetical protein M1508_00895 [Nitrospirae bacterium]|nr:hypothetical protein [Nitrospirota bacterium]MCL5420859.1 hypothetical protein [Nitrospirota bacterium]
MIIREMIAMGRNMTDQRNFPEEELAFERERLLNLIESKIKRREMDLAEGLAEELFKTEVGFVLLKKMKVLRRYTRLLLRIIFALVSVLLGCTIAMILDMRPSFNLLGQVLAVLGIILAVVVDGFLVKRFEKGLKMIMEVYETQKQPFIEWVLTNGIRCRLEDWQRVSGMTW